MVFGASFFRSDRVGKKGAKGRRACTTDHLEQVHARAGGLVTEAQSLIVSGSKDAMLTAVSPDEGLACCAARAMETP